MKVLKSYPFVGLRTQRFTERLLGQYQSFKFVQLLFKEGGGLDARRLRWSFQTMRFFNYLDYLVNGTISLADGLDFVTHFLWTSIQ